MAIRVFISSLVGSRRLVVVKGKDIAYSLSLYHNRFVVLVIIAIGVYNLYPTSCPTNYQLLVITKGETDIDPKKGTSKLSSALRADYYSSVCTSDNASQHKVTIEVFTIYLPRLIGLDLVQLP